MNPSKVHRPFKCFNTISNPYLSLISTIPCSLNISFTLSSTIYIFRNQPLNKGFRSQSKRSTHLKYEIGSLTHELNFHACRSYTSTHWSPTKRKTSSFPYRLMGKRFNMLCKALVSALDLYGSFNRHLSS